MNSTKNISELSLFIVVSRYSSHKTQRLLVRIPLLKNATNSSAKTFKSWRLGVPIELKCISSLKSVDYFNGTKKKLLFFSLILPEVNSKCLVDVNSCSPPVVDCYVLCFDNVFRTVINYLIFIKISCLVLFTNVDLCT